MRFSIPFLIVTFLALTAVVSGQDWEAVNGSWSTTAQTGHSDTTGWARLLSNAWYGDFDFSGHVKAAGHPAPIAIVMRFAGDSEGYDLILDGGTSRVSLRENHYGASEEVVAAPLPHFDQGAAFHVTAIGKKLTACITLPDAKPITLQFDDMKIPEGRVGLGVNDGEIAYGNLRLSGNTQTQFETYAFHCNYKLPDKVANQPLWKYLDAQGSELLKRYRGDYLSVQDFESRRQQILLDLRRSAGLDPWPERTPLKPRITGTVDRRDFKIEKIVFESQPGFLVDALLYIPKEAKFPVPGILSTIGHYAQNDFFIWSEQARDIGLARKGYVVLTYDPISQGERTWLGNGNHDTLRRKIILSGMEVSGLMFWDSMRAIDYLCSRPEVDPNRIGITGVSGGGFNAIYTAVLDNRVKAAAPDGFATTLEGVIKRADAGCCAYLPNLAQYAEFSDIYSLAAPRKLLILGGYMDVLSDRLLDVYQRARKVYRLYGAEDALQYYMDPNAGHTYSKPERLTMYRFFNKYLKGVDEPGLATEPHDPEDILISRESGILRVFPGDERGLSVVDLERRYLAKNEIESAWPSTAAAAKPFQNEILHHMHELMGSNNEHEPSKVSADDGVKGPGSIRHVTLTVDRYLPIPISIHHAAGPKRNRLILYFTMADRYPMADVRCDQVVDTLTNDGFDVALPEVRGTGPTRVDDMASVELYTMALGKHMFATRINDLRASIDFLKAQPEYQGERLIVWGEGPREGLTALYLAGLDTRVQSVVVSHGLVTYQNIVDEDGLPDFDFYIPGVLKYLDVPEMLAAIAPRPVIISSAVDINNAFAKQVEIQYASANRVFQLLGRPDRLSIVPPDRLVQAVRSE